MWSSLTETMAEKRANNFLIFDFNCSTQKACEEVATICWNRQIEGIGLGLNLFHNSL